MALKTKVMAGNITNLSDARYCTGMGVDWLSFPAASVNPAQFKEITDWVTGPEYVLEVDETTTIQDISQYPVMLVEIPYRLLSLIHQVPSKKWMVTLPLSGWEMAKSELVQVKHKIRHLIINADRPDPSQLNEIVKDFSVLVQLTDQFSMNDILSWPVDGIRIAGEDEQRPGLKDFEKLSSILEALEIVD